jgi:hypothetical protein
MDNDLKKVIVQQELNKSNMLINLQSHFVILMSFIIWICILLYIFAIIVNLAIYSISCSCIYVQLFLPYCNEVKRTFWSSVC